MVGYLVSVRLDGVATKDVLLFGAASDTETFSFNHGDVADSENLAIEALSGKDKNGLGATDVGFPVMSTAQTQNSPFPLVALHCFND